MAKKATPGIVSGEPGDQLFVGGETGIFQPRKMRIHSGPGFVPVVWEEGADWLDRLLADAARDAETVLREYLGEEWKSERKTLNDVFLTTGLEQKLHNGRKVLVDKLNHDLRILSQQQIEQLLDAVELLSEVAQMRTSYKENYSAESRMSACIELGRLWERMKMRKYEAAAVSGMKKGKGSEIGAERRRKLNEEQKQQVRNAINTAKQAGNKLLTVEKSLAKRFDVSPRTIKRAAAST